MSLKRFEQLDSEIRDWVKTKGWEVVGRAEYDAGSKIYSWRLKLRPGKASTLRIARKLLEDYPTFVVLYHLDNLNVAAAIRARPGAGFVLEQKGRTVSFEEAAELS